MEVSLYYNTFAWVIVFNLRAIQCMCDVFVHNIMHCIIFSACIHTISQELF